METITDIKTILELFVDQEGTRPDLKSPTRHEGCLYASNGKMLVSVADDPQIEAHGTFPTAKFAEIFKGWHQIQRFEPLRVILPDPQTCKVCNGRKRLQRCTTCDGEGTFRHQGWDYDCKPCDGNGVHANDLVELSQLEVVCFNCEGAGQELNVPVELHGKYYRRYYLEVLMKLDGIEIQADEVTDPLSLSLFRFRGGRGAIMPMRY
jgi:hypothetical protein